VGERPYPPPKPGFKNKKKQVRRFFPGKMKPPEGRKKPSTNQRVGGGGGVGSLNLSKGNGYRTQGHNLWTVREPRGWFTQGITIYKSGERGIKTRSGLGD